MLARSHTFSLQGLEARRVAVEVDIRPGLPAFVVVGLADAAVRESRERVRAALVNAGFEFPLRRIVVSLAPAHERKAGSGLDLAIACGVLAASGQVPPARLDRLPVFGELSLTGELRACRGTLAVAQGVRSEGLDAVVVPRERAREAALVEGLEVCGLRDLQEVAAVLRGEPAPPLPEPSTEAAGPGGDEPDLADVRGHRGAIEALTIAAAGGHNLLLCGPPGTGKTMLARRLPSILPPLSGPEAIEVTRIHSVLGLHAGDSLVERRPFRAPHHTISAAGLVGGGPGPAPGEATYAHRGVLFLDELSEFARPALEALRQPLEDGRVAIVRGQQTAVFPTAFALVAATNPCPCGFAGQERCRCGPADHARHARRLSGPLLDRIDLVVAVEAPSAEALRAPPVATSAQLRASVIEARERQEARLAGTGATANAEMAPRAVRRYVALDARAERVLDEAYRRGHLSARGRERALRVARTIADLGGRARVRADDVHWALGLRREPATLTEAA